MRIILAGGGTGGPITPLIAVMQKIKLQHQDSQFMLVGTNSGLEKKFAAQYSMPFASIPAGKFRRYFSFANFASPFLVLAGFIKSIFLIKKFKPDLVFGAGGFVSVPIIFAAALMGKKILVHQQDSELSLTNRITAPLADKITVSFENSLKDFSSGSGLVRASGEKENSKIIWTGNPVRSEFFHSHAPAEIAEIKRKFKIADQRPVILMLGGATGAAALNSVILQALPQLITFAEIIQSTGKNKGLNFQNPHYRQFGIVENIQEAYAVSNIVICRAGMGTISELAAVRKPAIIIPMPDSHQEKNAQALEQAGAAIVLGQKGLDGEKLLSIIKKLLYDGQWQRELSENIGKIMPENAAERIAAEIYKLCKP